MQGAFTSENRKNIANFYALAVVAAKIEHRQGNHLPGVWELEKRAGVAHAPHHTDHASCALGPRH